MSDVKACCCLPTNCHKCPYLNGKEITPIEINSLQTNINQYNRYPFKDREEAVYNMKLKKLLPGEIAIGYYYTADEEGKINGIDCIFGVGNLKGNDTIIKF
jgi:hypothetical protein